MLTIFLSVEPLHSATFNLISVCMENFRNAMLVWNPFSHTSIWGSITLLMEHVAFLKNMGRLLVPVLGVPTKQPCRKTLWRGSGADHSEQGICISEALIPLPQQSAVTTPANKVYYISNTLTDRLQNL